MAWLAGNYHYAEYAVDDGNQVNKVKLWIGSETKDDHQARQHQESIYTRDNPGRTLQIFSPVLACHGLCNSYLG